MTIAHYTIQRSMLAVSMLCGALAFIGAPLRVQAEDPAVYRYEVKGVVRQLPASAREEIFIRHEPIPDYVNADGKKVGMHAMTMPFWIADGVSLDGLAVGDAVSFSLESRWKPKAMDVITRIEKTNAAIPAGESPTNSEAEQHEGHHSH